ncbi:MAG: prolipoprotein diacylglyceryl transferase [Melioribacteraceae bacterium]|nr:prolipoprotein diacylglyceryl transferase [Melioribacteraceae bacterium]
MIEWNVSPDIIELGPFTLRWYGLLFAGSFIVGFKIMFDIFRREGKSEKDLNDLVWYMVLGTVIGARLGHCLFYNPEYYLSNPIEIIKVYRGGLASHGAAIGILAALYFFTKKRKSFGYLWILDRVVITVALAGAFIRTGNLMNSEIYGKPTDLPWAFVFTAVDDIPRHPTQIYEALAYLAIFFMLFKLYRSGYQKLKDGTFLGLFLIFVFGFRFFVEFLKENQTYFEEGMALNMGQILSVPLVILGVYLLYRKDKSGLKT